MLGLDWQIQAAPPDLAIRREQDGRNEDQGQSHRLPRRQHDEAESDEAPMLQKCDYQQISQTYQTLYEIC